MTEVILVYNSLLRDDMAFLLIVSITSLLAMLPYRKGSCSDFRITGSFRGNRTAPDLFEFIVFCLDYLNSYAPGKGLVLFPRKLK